ncbi:hypothetical protein Tco_0091721 [Tanacetum coccineum]
MAKFLQANEQLHKENEHLKQTYKELYDSIKKTRVQNKDNSESLISQINQKSVENADLKAQIQEKVFAKCRHVTQTNVDHAELLWEEFTQGIQTFFSHKVSHKASLKDPKKKVTPLLIPYGRFSKVIIYYLASNNNIHRRPDSAVHHTGDDFILGNLKFVPKGESVEVFGMAIPDPLITEAIQQSSYYPKYLEMVAENTKKTPQESASVQPATKHAPPKKTTTTTPVKQSKPAPALTKKPSKHKLPQKVRKGKPTFQLVDEDDEAQQESVPQEEGDDPDLELAKKMSLEAHQEKGEGEGDDADMERAIKLSLDPAFLPQGRAPVGGVTIRDPVAETTPKLPEVVGKGKAIVTEEQVAHSLIDLSKKKRTTDQFILVRRDQAPHESTTGPSSQPEDDTSEKVIHESSSTSDSERTESETETAAPKGDKDQGEVDSSTVTSGASIPVSVPEKAHEALAGPDPEPMQEDQTGSNSGKLHVSLAGPNPEHMDDEFLATAYPKVHENLKLITDERVIEENPESHSGSMSSMKNLDDTYNFGDQFLYDKPTEDDQEKSKVIEESDSTIPDPSHQTVTSTPPVIAPFTDVSSTKPSSLVTPPPINTEATLINQCLTGKTSGSDKPRHPVLQMLWGIVTQSNVDHAELLWEEFTQGIQTFFSHKASHKASLKNPKKKVTPLLIPYGRFSKVIIYYLASNNNIHRRPDSAVHHTGDDYILGNLKFVPKGESVEVFGMAIPDPLITEAIQQSSYYPKYLEMVAENTKKTPQESASVQPATKRATPKKPTTTTPVKQSKPAPPPSKKSSKRKLPQKVRKGKPTFQLVDEDDEAQQESIPQEEDDDPDLDLAKKLSLEAHQEKGEEEGNDADLERAIKLSLDPAFLPQGRAPVGGVTIRDPVSETTSKLHEVVGKGKAVVTEEQVAHSLIDLSKKKRTTDQFILVRRDQTPHDSTTGPSSQPEDDTLEKVIHESSSTSDSERTESETETVAPKGNKDLGETRPDPEPMQEDQTGSNSGKLHVSLAGPNPEHMDDEFLATAYPKVHENLKLITDERVIEENPESHSGSMSSMKNLDDTYNFGDQFLYDKPTKDDQEKSKVIEESDSTIPDPSHQTVTSTPPVIAPFTDVSSIKPSSLVSPPPINTEATTITTSLPEITPFIALQLRVARLEQEMSEVKKTDHSADVLASIKSQVPTVVDEYLGTKLDDALLKILERHTADLIEKYSVLPGPESIKNQESEKSPKEIIRIKREQGEEKQDSTYSIRSTDKVALEEFDLKSALFKHMNKNKTANRNPANYHLYHALMEALIADEDAMDKEVTVKVKDHKRKHDSDDDEDDDDDEGPSAGSNQGRSAKRRRPESAASGSAQPPPKDDDQSSKKPRESDASASKQHPALTSTGWQITDTRDDVVNSLMHKSDPESEHSEQSSDDILMQDEGHVSDMEDTVGNTKSIGHFQVVIVLAHSLCNN